MKIDSTPKTEHVASKPAAETSRAATGPIRSARGQNGLRVVAEPGGDKLTLSSTAAQLIELANATGKADEAHQQRIEALKAQVASGQYQPEPAKVADGLLRDLLVQSAGTESE
ncbi:MAG: flagellar biosynthesis anti-sigma factor FlgM [Deltaproteobacteria bacterium]|jgi:flagellar biosynthesis anti-sigma factor FlgM|nr:flagellar biosynthesis anti-sigma factor FlgM [Deltaproteobacteria bacterium]